MIVKIYENKTESTHIWVHFHPSSGSLVIWTQDQNPPYTASMFILTKDEAKDLVKTLNNYLRDSNVSC